MMTLGSALFSLLLWSLPLGFGVYLWRWGSRGVLARLRRTVPFAGSGGRPQPSAAPPHKSRLRILFLAANPTSSAHLDLTREARQIEERIDAGRRRLEFVTHWAVRRSDLQRLLLEVKPHVLHFSGHGSVRSQLLLEDDEGNPVHVEKQALVNLVGIIPGNLQLVVLNACDTEPVAEALVQHVACAIGMREPIGNDAAIAFAAAFYQALGFDEPVATAFRLGCNELELRRIPEEGTPSLKVKRGVDAETLVLTTP
jgi:CHAT domain